MRALYSEGEKSTGLCFSVADAAIFRGHVRGSGQQEAITSYDFFMFRHNAERGEGGMRMDPEMPMSSGRGGVSVVVAK